MGGYKIAEPAEDDSNPFPGADGTQFDLLGALDLTEMRMRLWYFEPGGSSTLHKHGVQEEVYYFLDGPGNIQFGQGTDAEVIEVPEGAAVKVDAGVTRQIQNPTDTTIRLLAVSAPNEMEGEIWDSQAEEYVTIHEWFQR